MERFIVRETVEYSWMIYANSYTEAAAIARDRGHIYSDDIDSKGIGYRVQRADRKQALTVTYEDAEAFVY